MKAKATIGIVCVAVGLLGWQAAVAERPATQAAVITFRHVRVFDGDAAIERATVVIRDGRIAEVGADVVVPAGATVVEGDGRTLLPGLIDAHVHAFGTALERAPVFGVTTVVDMFTDHGQAAQWRREQQAAGGAPRRADILSAGTMVTAPKGHGTQYGLPIPTITSSAEAEAFVEARLAEGSDFIKIVYDDGQAPGRPSIDAATLRAVIAAARARDRLAVVHVSTLRAARTALEAGASGLVHIFADAAATPELVALAREQRAFVIPTLSLLESVTGTPGSLPLLEVETLVPFFTPTERAELKATFPAGAAGRLSLPHALDAVRALHAAGVPILAGSDAPNPGTLHGATIHRELELLVRAGLSPAAALRAATSAPAQAFGLRDRGRIAPGLRADLVLVEGDPTQDVTATRRIVDVWKGGARLERRRAPSDAAAAVGSGEISRFDAGEIDAAFGAGWQISTDAMMGGASEARMQIVTPGASDSAGALEVTGTLQAGFPFTWAGAMFFPGPSPMAPADLSRFTEVAFKARGDGRTYQVLLFASRLGQQPAVSTFEAGPDWQEHVITFRALSEQLDGTDITGLLFSAGPPPGDFRFQIDDVRLR